MLLISPNHNDPAGNDNRDGLSQEKRRKEKTRTGLISYSPYKFAGYCKGALTKAFLVKEKTEAKR
ncbi:MAG: hypothetical protein WAM88_03235 [Nitrososphaeraceae archaeon]